MENKKTFISKIIFSIVYLIAIVRAIEIIANRKRFITFYSDFDMPLPIITRLYFEHGHIIGSLMIILTLLFMINEKIKTKKISLETISLSFLCISFYIIICTDALWVVLLEMSKFLK